MARASSESSRASGVDEVLDAARRRCRMRTRVPSRESGPRGDARRAPTPRWMAASRAGVFQAFATSVRPRQASSSSLPVGSAAAACWAARSVRAGAHRDHGLHGVEELDLLRAQEVAVDVRHPLAGLGVAAAAHVVDGLGEPAERDRRRRDDAARERPGGRCRRSSSDMAAARHTSSRATDTCRAAVDREGDQQRRHHPARRAPARHEDEPEHEERQAVHDELAQLAAHASRRRSRRTTRGSAPTRSSLAA